VNIVTHIYVVHTGIQEQNLISVLLRLPPCVHENVPCLNFSWPTKALVKIVKFSPRLVIATYVGEEVLVPEDYIS
jgi:hypothetical protein